LIGKESSNDVTEISFSKCHENQQIKETLNSLYEASPFKNGIHMVKGKPEKGGIIKQLIDYESQEYTPLLNQQ
jgi:hypothetical protein